MSYFNSISLAFKTTASPPPSPPPPPVLSERQCCCVLTVPLRVFSVQVGLCDEEALEHTHAGQTRRWTAEGEVRAFLDRTLSNTSTSTWNRTNRLADLNCRLFGIPCTHTHTHAHTHTHTHTRWCEKKMKSQKHTPRSVPLNK